MLDIFAQFGGFITFLLLFFVGYFIGSWSEKKHYSSIETRESENLSLPAVSMSKSVQHDAISESKLVMGNVVISIDYFKRVLASLRNIVGGRVSTYETLVDRARREAMLRMKENAKGAKIIVNVRIETSAIGASANRKNSVGSVEAIAYGTAVWS